MCIHAYDCDMIGPLPFFSRAESLFCLFLLYFFLHSHFHFIINVIVVCTMSSSPRSLSNDLATLDVTTKTRQTGGCLYGPTASVQSFKSGSSLAKSVPTAKGGETHVFYVLF